MIYVTHDQDEALNMSDRIMLMNAGAIEQIGTPEEMYAAPVSRFAAGFLGHSTLIPGEITAPGVARLACGTTVRVHHGVAPGAGHLLLRPENVRIDTAGETLAPQTNRLEGVLSGTLVTAGVVKHFVTLDDGTVLVVQELANERRTQLGAGTRVTATWSARVGLFLNR